MPFFRSKPYNRNERLAAANLARSRGKTAKAILEYQKVLKETPQDAVVHGKLAPLLAESKRFADAWNSFKIAARGQEGSGYTDRAIALYIQAAAVLPRTEEVWLSLVDLQRQQGKRAEVIKTLLKGRTHFKTRRDRPVAIKLLKEVLKEDAHHTEGILELARLLAKSGQKNDAKKMLDDHAEFVRGNGRKRVLRERFFIVPGFRTLIEWIKA